MKILYVILSCDKYKDTRQKWQRETWLKDMHPMNHVYLNEHPDGLEDNYKNAPYKYISFFKLLTDNVREHFDWLFFCDDDTFVYTEKLEELLSTEISESSILHLSDSYMIGFYGGRFKIYNLEIGWCSGGAGIALNREVVKNIQTHLRNTPKPLVTDETDISLAIWATMANKELFVIDNKRFSPFNPLDAAREGMRDCITYHYVERKDFYELYGRNNI